MSRGSSNSVFLGVDVGTGSARAGSISDSLFFDPLFYLPFLFFRVRIRLCFLNLAIAGILLNYQLARDRLFPKLTVNSE